MPRFKRDIEPGSVQHVISRFAGGEFQLDLPKAREVMLRSIARSLRESDWVALAYALMSNHVHWVFIAGQRPLRSLFQPTHVRFARWLRSAHGGLGPVFADRPRNVSARGATAAAVIAYVHNNPVRARVVPTAEASDWTSHNMYLGTCAPPPWLDVNKGLEVAGFRPGRRGRLAYAEYVVSLAAAPHCPALSGLDQEARRTFIRARARNPLELASSHVMTLDARPGADSPLRSGARACPPSELPARAVAGATPMDVIDLVAGASGLAAARLRSRDRTRAVTRARKVALWLWARDLELPVGAMSNTLGLAASSASSLLSRTWSQGDEWLLMKSRQVLREREDGSETRECEIRP